MFVGGFIPKAAGLSIEREGGTLFTIQWLKLLDGVQCSLVESIMD